MIFNREQATAILAGKITTALITHTEMTTPAVRPFRRRIMRHDADGIDIGYETQIVTEGDAEENRPVMLTILSAQTVWMWELSKDDLAGTGAKTIEGLVAAWRADHPREDRCTLVRFAIGDLRDEDRYIARGVGYTGSHHQALDPDAPAVSALEQMRQTKQARERAKERAQDRAVELGSLPISQRVEIIDGVRIRRRVDLTKELRIIEERVRRAERALREEAA